jgi:hypothetical protein
MWSANLLAFGKQAPGYSKSQKSHYFREQFDHHIVNLEMSQGVILLFLLALSELGRT